MRSAKNEKKRATNARLTLVFAAAFAFVFSTFGDATAIDFSINIPFSRIFRPRSNDLDATTNVDFNEADSSASVPPVASISPEKARSAPISPNSATEEPTPFFSDRLPYNVVLGQVVCEANFPIESVAGLEAEIVQLQRDLVDYLGVPIANEPIKLCLFRDKGSYIDFIGAEFPKAPLDRPALYVKASGGPGVLMIPKDDKILVNIRHEMTHAYLNAALRNVPIWLDEGLAKYFETPPGERGFRNPFLKAAERDASGIFSSPPSLERLEKLTRIDQMRTREYRESWSWVHFMIHYSNDTHRVLGYYLRSLRPEEQAGISMKEAFKRQKKAPTKRLLEKYVPDYEKKYVEHFRTWNNRQAEYENARVESIRAASEPIRR